MFQLKDFVSIAAAILNHAKATQSKLTDFNVGSVARTMLEAPAVEIEELYQQMWNGLRESIPVAVFNSFDFPALEARSASGIVRVTITSSGAATSIPAGTTFVGNDAGLTRFTLLQDATIAAGNTFADLKVSAETPGAAGNVGVGVGFTAQPAISGFVSAVGTTGFVDGIDAETLDERRARFREYVATLNRGTVESLKYGAKQARVMDESGFVTEAVKGVVVYEPWLTDSSQPVALVKLYVHNGVDGASGALLAEVQKVIDGYYNENGDPVPGWKAAGVKVEVYAATAVPVAVTATVTVSSGYVSANVLLAVEDAIREYLNGLDVGADVIRAEIIAAAMSVDGVFNVSVSAPAADTVVAFNAKAMAGTMALTAA